MAQLALNRFKTVTLEVTNTEQTVYTAPTGYTAIVLYAHVANHGTIVSHTTLKHVRSSTETEILSQANVPLNDALVPITGKMVLETNDSIKIVASDNNTLKVILSILETAN